MSDRKPRGTHSGLIEALTWLLDDMADAGQDGSFELDDKGLRTNVFTEYDSAAFAREALRLANGQLKIHDHVEALQDVSVKDLTYGASDSEKIIIFAGFRGTVTDYIEEEESYWRYQVHFPIVRDKWFLRAEWLRKLED